MREATVYLRDRLPLAVFGLGMLLLLARGRLWRNIWWAANWGRKMSRWFAVWKVVRAMLPRPTKLN
jgi:hypothetical protein